MKRKEKRTLHGVLTLMLMLGLMLIPGLLPETACAAEGLTQDNNGVYQIEDYADLKAFAEIVNGKEGQDAKPAACGKLMDNITCDDKEWVPIGKDLDHSYIGCFDGNNKVIEGLSNENRSDVGNADFQGLFGCIGKRNDEAKGEVKNVGLKGGKIIGRDYVGGVAGANYGGEITNCYNSGAVSGTADSVGGVAGTNNAGVITNCYNSGAVNGSSNIGGVAGINNNGGTITNCYISGPVSGSSNIGGVAGYIVSGGITNCYNTGAVSGTGDEVGGVAGANYGGEITNCYNSGAVSGSSIVGGVAGEITDSEISNCYNSGAVSGTGDFVGGVAGYLDEGGTISNCYNSGAVSGTGDEVGGVAGLIESGTITNCYNSGAVSGTGDFVGGVAGYSYSREITNCYYDKTFSMVSRAIGGKEDTGSVKGLTTSQMTGETALDNMVFDTSVGNPWLVKANEVDEASGEYYEYYPHLKGFNLDSQGRQLDAKKISPADWPAKPHIHTVGNEHVYFMPWVKTDQLPDQAGSYYLTGDVSLDSEWNPDGTVHLCLNDHGIEYKSNDTGSVMIVGSNCKTFDLFDCGVTTRYYYIDDDGLGRIVASEEDDKYVNAEADQKGTFKGGFITGGGGDDGAVVFRSGGSFNMNGGTIIGNEASFGGAVDVNGGFFVMNGGNIIGNKAAYGGIAYVENAGNFTMNGGNIIANRSNIGGFYVTTSGSFTMNGGRITGNQVIKPDESYKSSGTIYLNSTGNAINMSGAPVIIGNKFGTDGEANDICLPDGKKITITGKLQLPDGASTPQIGITMEGATVSGTKGVFTSGYSENNPGEDPGKYFMSNDDSYAVYFDENKKEAQLIARTDISGGTCSFDDGLTYSGKEISPDTMTLTLSDTDIRELKLDTDYIIKKYKDGNGGEMGTSKPKYAGSYTAAVEGIGKYKGNAAVAFTIKRAPLTITAKDKTLTYNGQTQGEGDTVYTDAEAIAERVAVEGLQGGDTLTSIEIFSQGEGIKVYPIQVAGATVGNAGRDVTLNYEITYVDGKLTIKLPPATSIDNAPVVLDDTPLVYTGQPVTPVIKTIGGKELMEGRDYTVRYSQGDTLIEAPTDAGTYTMTITGKGNYAGSTSTEFTIGKAAGTLTASGNKVKTKSKTVKLKKAKKISADKAYTIEGTIGELAFSKVKASKAAKRFKVNETTGQIKVKKGLKKGKYELTVLISDPGDKNHETAEAEAIVTIRIRK